ncbi:MAG: FtsX-like permease family protein [Acidimicrobiales bacterium]
MGVIAFLVRSELRRRWRTYGVLALVLGVVTGTAMASAAGARRTATSYDRLLAVTNADDVLVNPDDGNADFDAIEALPQVADSCRAWGAFASLIGPDGEPDFTTPHIPFVSDGRCLYDLSGPARIAGRLPDPDEPYETLLSRQLADDLGLEAGDALPLYVFEGEEPTEIELRVTGTGVYGQDALSDPENEASFPLLLLTPAFGAEHPVDPDETFTGSLVQLRGGEADLAAFNAAAIDVSGETMHLEDRWANQRKAALALEPYELALWLFALAVVLAGGGLLVGGLHRALTGLRATQRTLSSLGVEPSARRAVPLAVTACVGAAGALVGVALATATSVLTPIGPAHDIEPDPGIAVDRSVALVGVLASIAVALAIGAIVAARLDRAEPGVRDDVGWFGRMRLALPAPAGAGLRLATGELGGNRSAARSTIAGAALGVAGVLTVLVVGAGLARVVEQPQRYGWTWDAFLTVSEDSMEDYREAGGGPAYQEVIATLDDVGVGRHTAVSYGQLDVAGETVAAVGLGDSTGPVTGPGVLEGRLPTADDEIALGSTSLQRVGADLGDRVEVSFGSERRAMHIVGRSVFPRMTEYPGAPHTGLGDGAVVSADALSDLSDALPYASILIDADGAALDALRATYPVGDSLDIDAPVVMVERPQRPDALFGYDSTGTVRQVLAYLLGGLTIASVALGLAAGARAARRELAVLRTVGFTRKQARQVVYVHGALVAVAAIGIGVPLGVAAGRVGWRAFADHLGVASDPSTPALHIAATAVLAVATCALLSLLPARATASRAPAEVLRAE